MLHTIHAGETFVGAAILDMIISAELAASQVQHSVCRLPSFRRDLLGLHVYRS